MTAEGRRRASMGLYWLGAIATFVGILLTMVLDSFSIPGESAFMGWTLWGDSAWGPALAFLGLWALMARYWVEPKPPMTAEVRRRVSLGLFWLGAIAFPVGTLLMFALDTFTIPGEQAFMHWTLWGDSAWGPALVALGFSALMAGYWVEPKPPIAPETPRLTRP